jgi:hypothetical protein
MTGLICNTVIIPIPSAKVQKNRGPILQHNHEKAARAGKQLAKRSACAIIQKSAEKPPQQI